MSHGDPNTGNADVKVATKLQKEYPTEHLNAGEPNKATANETHKTADILGDRTRFPKPITNDKAWKNK